MDCRSISKKPFQQDSISTTPIVTSDTTTSNERVEKCMNRILSHLYVSPIPTFQISELENNHCSSSQQVSSIIAQINNIQTKTNWVNLTVINAFAEKENFHGISEEKIAISLFQNKNEMEIWIGRDDHETYLLDRIPNLKWDDFKNLKKVNRDIIRLHQTG